jgi:hypothetical protein
MIFFLAPSRYQQEIEAFPLIPLIQGMNSLQVFEPIVTDVLTVSQIQGMNSLQVFKPIISDLIAISQIQCMNSFQV